jgi:hypothetical protein
MSATTKPTRQGWSARWSTRRLVPIWTIVLLCITGAFAWMGQEGRSAYTDASRFQAEGVAETATGSEVFLETHSGGRGGSDIVGTMVRVRLPGQTEAVLLDWPRDRSTEDRSPVDFRTGWFPRNTSTGYAPPLAVHVLHRGGGAVAAMADADMTIWLQDPDADNAVLAVALWLGGLMILLVAARASLIMRARRAEAEGIKD